MDGDEQTPVVETKDFATPLSDNSTSTETTTEATTSPESEHPPLDIPKKGESRTVSEMSGSYHEIFDASHGADFRGKSEIGVTESAVECYFNTPEELLLCPDNGGNTEKTTEYLTSKLVEDSLKWQQEHFVVGGGPSAMASPSRQLEKSLLTERKPEPAVDILDQGAINDIERHARHLASSVDNLVENLSGLVQSISALTVDSIDAYRDSVCKTCDEVDNNIKSMYQLMAKVEELNKSMGPAYKLGEQIKEIKKLLDLYDNAAAR